MPDTHVRGGHIDATGVVRLLLAIGAIISMTLELRAGEFTLFSLVFAAWVALPFYLLFATTNREDRNASRATLCIGATLLAGTSFMAYRPTSIGSSSTAGLVFLFLPLWQLLGVAVIGWIARRLGRRYATGERSE